MCTGGLRDLYTSTSGESTTACSALTLSLFFKTANRSREYIERMRSSVLTIMFVAALSAACLNAQVRPDVAGQKSAMDKLRFLAGTWTGKAVITTGDGKQITIQQTEEVKYKLEGLLLLIEGTGRDDARKVVFNAVAAVSFDQNSGTYRIRAWNGGNFIETEMKVADKTFEWGFRQGPLTMVDHMIVDEEGRWSEVSNAVLADGRKVHSVKMLLSRTQ